MRRQPLQRHLLLQHQCVAHGKIAASRGWGGDGTYEAVPGMGWWRPTASAVPSAADPATAWRKAGIVGKLLAALSTCLLRVLCAPTITPEATMTFWRLVFVCVCVCVCVCARAHTRVCARAHAFVCACVYGARGRRAGQVFVVAGGLAWAIMAAAHPRVHRWSSRKVVLTPTDSISTHVA
jgi:hypothetical protein